MNYDQLMLWIWSYLASALLISYIAFTYYKRDVIWSLGFTFRTNSLSYILTNLGDICPVADAPRYKACITIYTTPYIYLSSQWVHKIKELLFTRLYSSLLCAIIAECSSILPNLYNVKLPFTPTSTRDREVVARQFPGMGPLKVAYLQWSLRLL